MVQPNADPYAALRRAYGILAATKDNVKASPGQMVMQTTIDLYNDAIRTIARDGVPGFDQHTVPTNLIIQSGSFTPFVSETNFLIVVDAALADIRQQLPEPEARKIGFR